LTDRVQKQGGGLENTHTNKIKKLKLKKGFNQQQQKEYTIHTNVLFPTEKIHLQIKTFVWSPKKIGQLAC